MDYALNGSNSTDPAVGCEDICAVCSRDVEKERIPSGKHNCGGDIRKRQDAETVGDEGKLPGIRRRCKDPMRAGSKMYIFNNFEMARGREKPGKKLLMGRKRPK
ncbi:hypothetical protein G7Y89_g2003 [Cudoniella acicularis]|uniref:Uncharacterized protein n=1 Tax=Cudoniella acicularis TaxID=354080 RepID=A0A8H4W6G7_9HELO|nr:hypothetical protein G7Y89_g2003 [Cudoniella acicularis]